MALGGTDILTIDIANPSLNPIPLSGINFMSSLPAGLTVGSALNSMCGGLLATWAPRTILLDSAFLMPGSHCQLQVVVTGAANGAYSVTGMISSHEGGNGTSASTGVIVATYAPPIITAQFGASSLQVGGTTSLTFTITNPNVAVNPNAVRPAALAPGDLTGIGFSDTLPSGLAIATPNGLTGDCGGGTITAPAGGQTISLTGASLAAGASCSFSVAVLAVSAGVQENSTGPVGSVQAASGDPGSATLTVGSATPPPTTTGGPAGTPDPTNVPAIALALAFGAIAALALAARRKGVEA
jgi:hypothetical protein